MATSRFEVFSLTHAQILDGETTFIEAALAATAPDDEDVYGVNEASFTPNKDSYTNEGDDVEKSIWKWLKNADLHVQAGYISLPLIANMTEQEAWSSGSGADEIFAVDLWNEADFNVPPKPMIVRMPSKDEDGVVRTATIGLYKVQFEPITFEGPKYKDGLKINYDGTALMSLKDETGTPFPDGKNRVGRILSHK